MVGGVFQASKGGVTMEKSSTDWIDEKSADHLLYCLLSLESKLSKPESNLSASTALPLTLEHFWRAMGTEMEKLEMEEVKRKCVHAYVI